MKQLLIFLLVAVTITISGQATAQTSGGATDWIGGEFGSLLQKGEKPQLGYAITKTFTLEKVPLVNSLLGTLAQGWEGSVLYSDRQTDLTQELYAVRVFNYRVFAYKGWFVGMGVGMWTFANTDGSDPTKTAAKGGFGFAKGPLIIRAAGDAVSFEGNDLYFVHLGIVFNL